MKKLLILFIVPLLSFCSKTTTEPVRKPDNVVIEPEKNKEPAEPTEPRKELIYRKVGDAELKMVINYPTGHKKGDRMPAIVFFYGGGWFTASSTQFSGQANRLKNEGMITILADYRVKNIHNTTPFDALDDAKHAVSFLREHAADLGINENMLAAGGGSAGGHLAAATDLTGNGKAEGSAFSCRPNALVLFNPVFNNGPGNYGYDRIGSRYMEFSPFHNIKKGAAPAIIFLGTKDEYIPVSVAEDYKKAMDNVGSRCDLYLYEGQEHGFFNRPPYFDETLEKATVFLRSLGYLPPLKNR